MFETQPENIIDPKSSSTVTPHEGERSSTPSTRQYFDTLQALHDFDAQVEREQLQKRNVIPEVAAFMRNADILWGHRDFNLAISLLRQAVHKFPQNIDLMKSLAFKLEKLHKFSEALILWRAIALKEGVFESYAKWADILYKQGEDDLALSKYYEALALLCDETSLLFDVYKNMGNILVRQGDFDGAEEFYNKAYTMNPLSDLLLVNLGTLHIQRQDYEKSTYCFRKAVEVNRKNDKAWVGLSIVHNQMGDSELAMANLEEAIQINPGNRTAVHIFAAWAEKYQKRAEAIEVLQEYLSTVDEADEEMSLVLINLLCICGRYDFAQLECERVLLWNPESTEVRNLQKKLRKQEI